MNFKFLKRKIQGLTLVVFSLIALMIAAPAYAENWTVVLQADNGEKTAEVSFGIAEGATDSFDLDLDSASAPAAPGASLSINFPGDLTALRKDIRGLPDTGQTVSWELKITTDVAGKLSWNIAEIPAGWSVFIGQTDMSIQGEMGFTLGSNTLIIEATSSDVPPAMPPTITEVNPNTGPIAGGTTIIVLGTNFQQGATVEIGGKSATDVAVTSSTNITAKTPTADAGLVEVAVTNPDGKSATLAEGFNYTTEEPPAQKAIWIVTLTANSGDNKAIVSFGIANGATDDYDIGYDVGLPPSSPETMPLTMSFANELTDLEKDIRGTVTSTQKVIIWTLNIKSDAPVTLSWEQDNLPQGWRLTIDEKDMNVDQEISFAQGIATMAITAEMSEAVDKDTDVNSDGKVDVSDLTLVGRNFGAQGEDIDGDVNGDGEVNILDLALVIIRFGIIFTP